MVAIKTYMLVVICAFLFGIRQPLAQSTEINLSKAQHYHSNSQIDSAIYFYKRAIQLNYETGRAIEALNLAVDIADIFYAINDFQSGIEVLEVITGQPLSYSEEEERTALLEAYLFFAYGLESSGRFIKAKDIYETTRLHLVNKSEYEDFYVARYLYQPLGNIYTRLGELEEALKLLERFKEISISEEEYNAAAQAINDIGIIYKSLNHYDKVIGDFQSALEFPGLSLTTKGLLLSNLATSYYETSQTKEALISAQSSVFNFQKALKNGTRSREVLPYLSQTYSTIGKIHTSQNNPEKAIENFRQSIELAVQAYGTSRRREVAKIHINIGYLYLHQNEAEKAIEHYQAALGSLIRDFQFSDIHQNPNVNSLYPENSIFEALEGKTRALELLYENKKETGLLKNSLECFDLIFNVEMLLRKDYLNESSKLLMIDESHRRSERALNTAYLLYSTTGDPAYIIKAFQFSERNKATILLESLRSLKITDFSNIPDSLLSEEQELKSNIALLKKGILYAQPADTEADHSKIQSLSEELFKYETNLQQLNATLKTTYPHYYRLKQTIHKDVNIKDLRDWVLSANGQLISYFFGESNIYIFSLTQDDFQMKKVGNAASIDSTVQNLLQHVTKKSLDVSDPEIFAGYSFKIYKELLEPVIKEDKQKLIVVPDGVLGYLPFDLLIDEKASNPKFNKLSYLVTSRTISYGFSASTLLESSATPPATEYKETFLGFAPGFRHSSVFSFLPFSEKEVRSIQQTFNGRILLNEEATKVHFMDLAAEYQILHLSSHASVVDSLPLYSWISFSDQASNNEDDYKLYLSELYSMRLKANLVVLSACETGSGKLSRGEGIMSLARGFTFAGCNSIVTTLWPVNDASTSLIMVRFYHHLAKGLEKDEALRMAKIDYLNEKNTDQFGANPFFWAAYIPVGNVEAIPSPSRKNTVWLLWGVSGLFVLGISYYMTRSKTKKAK